MGKNASLGVMVSFTKHQCALLMKSSLILILFSLILFFIEFFIPIEYYHLTGKTFHGQETLSLIFFIICSFLFFYFIPIMLAKYIYQTDLASLGLSLPKNKLVAYFFIVCGLVLLIPSILLISKQPQVQFYYSLGQVSDFKIIFLIVIIFPLYYFFEEFFFRGFIFLHLYKKIGKHAYWISDLIFTFAHANKPISEIMLALPAGIIFAYITLKTKSIYPSMIIHYSVGVTLLLAVNHMI